MRWPTATDVTYLRQRQDNYSRVYLGVQRGKERTDVTASLMVGQHYQIVAADTYTAADHYLTFTTPNFLANTDIQVGMTLSVGTLTDPTLYGAARIIQVDATNNRIVLEENNIFALGHLTTSEYIWVDGVYRLYRILPFVDVDNDAGGGAGAYYEEGNSTGTGAVIPGAGIAHPANSDVYDYRPVALMGSPRFAWAGENVDFYGWRSHGRATNTITHWTWNFDGGVCTGPGLGYPGSPSSPIHVSWATAGEYIASLTVRDSSGNTNPDAYGIRYDEHTAVRPVLVYDRPGQGSNTPYTDFEVNSLTGRFGQGWEARITVFGTANKSEFPDNALIILYAEDWYNGQRRSMGGWYGQEEILFCGYIRAGSVMIDSEKSTVTFEAQTIDQWMREIGVWPANFIDPGAVPSIWHQFNNMTVEDCLWHLASLHSTLKNVADCYFASDVGVEKLLGCVDLTESSLYDQMSGQLGSCFFGTVTASRQGSVHLFKHKNMLDRPERMSFGPPVRNFTAQDWHSELTVGEERMRNSVAQVDFIGFIYDTNRQPQDVFSLAPAHQTHFGRIEKVTGILLTGTSIGAAQAENNTLSGLYLAWKNTRFPQIALHAFNDRFLDPATLDYFSVYLTAPDTVRGYSWPWKEFLCTGVSYHIDVEKGIILVDVEGEASTWGPDGVAGDYPRLPPEEPGQNPGEGIGEFPSASPPPGADVGDGELGRVDCYLVAQVKDNGGIDGYIIRGEDVANSDQYAPVYTNLGMIDSDGLYWMALDEFDPENKALAVGPDRVWRTTNLSDPVPTWTEVLNEGTFELHMVRSSPVQEHLWMVSGYTAANAGIWWSTQGGAPGTWDSVETLTGPGNVDGCWSTFLEMSWHDASVAWVVWIDRTNDYPYCAVTTDMWNSHTIITPGTACFGGEWERPPIHHRRLYNRDHQVALWGGVDLDASPDESNVYLCQNITTNCTCVNLGQEAAETPVVGIPMLGSHYSSQNRWWALANSGKGIEFHISDDGTNWTEVMHWTRDLTVGGSLRVRDGVNLKGSYEWFLFTDDGAVGPIWRSIDRMNYWQQQYGNWAAMIAAEGLASPDIYCIAPMRGGVSERTS